MASNSIILNFLLCWIQRQVKVQAPPV